MKKKRIKSILLLYVWYNNDNPKDKQSATYYQFMVKNLELTSLIHFRQKNFVCECSRSNVGRK